MQGRREADRGRLGVVTCAIVLGLVAGCTDRSVTASPSELAPVATGATPDIATPATAPVATPSAAASAAQTQSREISWRKAREEAIRVQQRLRAEELARKSAQQEQAKRERCVGGQRMKRVENGWVQAGTC
jgi:hypothetical protein